MIYTFTAVDGNLMAWGAKLRRLGANEFSDLVGNPILFKYDKGTMTATLTLQGQVFFLGERVPDIHLNEAALSAFSGDYRSDELDATYKLSLVKGALSLQVGTQPPVSLNPVAPNEFEAADLGTVVFQGTRNRISGLTFFSARARGISFRKLQ